MARQLDIELYVKALTDLKKMSEKMIPIKKTEFIRGRKLSDHFFKFLIEMKVISPLKEISPLREGARFDWHYKQADNELDSHLANKLMDKITEQHRISHAYYNSDAYKKKKAKAEFKEQERLRKEQEKLQKQREKQLKLNPIQGATEVITFEPQEEPQENKQAVTHSELSFNLKGDLSREEILKKLEFLILNTTITSFKVEVSYK